MKRIRKITVERIPDYDGDLSYLGTFSNEQESAYAIEHEPSNSRTLAWFNPQETSGDTPANLRKYAQQNYKRMMAYERGEWGMLGIIAKAEIHTSEQGGSWLINTIKSGGIYGIESDMEEADYKEIQDEQLDALYEVLRELGFDNKDIKEFKVEVIK